MVKASDIVGLASPESITRHDVTFTLNNEVSDILELPPTSDGDFYLYEFTKTALRLDVEATPQHQAFKVGIWRRYNTFQYSILEGAVTAANSSANTATLFTITDGLMLGQAITPDLDAEAVVLDTPGSGNWTVPDGVTSICIVCIGAGGGGDATSGDTVGGGGGALAYRNNIAVTPGQQLPYTVGAAGAWEQAGGDTSIAGCVAGGGGGSTGTNIGAGGLARRVIRWRGQRR